MRHPVAVGIGLLAQFVLLPLAAIYDYVAGGDDYAGCDGSNLIYFPIFNYLGGSLDPVYQMLRHPQALLAPGDAGTHVGTVCAASLPTTLPAHWTRDRVVKPAAGTSKAAGGAAGGAAIGIAPGKLSVEQAVAMLTSRNARHMGLQDRGVIAPGMKADLNVIDYAHLAAGTPALVRDLPAGGKRFVQKAQGYLTTICGGQVVCAKAASALRARDAGPGRGDRGITISSLRPLRNPLPSRVCVMGWLEGRSPQGFSSDAR